MPLSGTGASVFVYALLMTALQGGVKAMHRMIAIGLVVLGLTACSDTG